MKASQLYSHLFVYILTIVLVSFILVYGYNAIKNLNDKANQIACLKFKNDLENEVKKVSGEYGIVDEKDIQICPGYSKVCFVENVEQPDLPGGTDPIIKDSVASNAEKNVFLAENSAEESFYIGRISVEPDVLCIKAIGGRIRLRLEGKGNYALISQRT